MVNLGLLAGHAATTGGCRVAPLAAIGRSALSLGVSRSILRKNFRRSAWAWRCSPGLMPWPSRTSGAALGSVETVRPHTQCGFRSCACACRLTQPGLKCRTAASLRVPRWLAAPGGLCIVSFRRVATPTCTDCAVVRPAPLPALHPGRRFAFVPVRKPRAPEFRPNRPKQGAGVRQQTCVHSPVKHHAAGRRACGASTGGRLRHASGSAVHRLLPNGTEFNRESSGLHRGDIFKKIRGCDCASPPKR